MGPTQTKSLGGNKYIYVVIDDFSRYTPIDFLREKSNIFKRFTFLYQKLTIEKHFEGTKIVRIKSDSSKKFKMLTFLDSLKSIVFLISFLLLKP